MKKQPVGIVIATLAGGLLLASAYPTAATSADVVETREQREARIYLEVLHSDIAKMKAHGIGVEVQPR